MLLYDSLTISGGDRPWSLILRSAIILSSNFVVVIADNVPRYD